MLVRVRTNTYWGMVIGELCLTVKEDNKALALARYDVVHLQGLLLAFGFKIRR